MAQLYFAGEQKIRPGVYYRYTNASAGQQGGAMDGVNAIVAKASWGPVGVVTVHETANNLKETYGDGAETALMLFNAGARRVYMYRPEGTGGVAGKATVGNATIEAKYVGARALKVKIQTKPGSTTQKECIVLDGATQLEKVAFAVSEGNECSALKTALENSAYVTCTFETDGALTAGEYPLEGGADPTVTTEDYLKGFYALEPFNYNVLSTDSAEDAVAQIMLAYVNEAEIAGKLVIGVIGDTTTEFAARCAKAKGYNDKNIVFMGSAFTAGEEVMSGAKAINYAAGLISSTPSNQSIVHSVVQTATDLPEKLTNAQYEEAIQNGMLMLSIGPNGQIWFDSGVNTLVTPAQNEDNGWKKIKRTKVRFELMDRLDKVVAPLVGKVNCDPDGVGAVIHVGMGVINEMVAERKLASGASIIEDPDNPHVGDSAWFVIDANDIDSLEKIYLHYQFRYSQA